MPLASPMHAKSSSRAWWVRALRMGLGLRQHPKAQRQSLGLGLWLALVVASTAAAAPPKHQVRTPNRPLPQGAAGVGLARPSVAPSRPPRALPAHQSQRGVSSAIPVKPLPHAQTNQAHSGLSLARPLLVRGPAKAGGSPKRAAQPLLVHATPLPTARPSASPSTQPVVAQKPELASVAVVERLAWRGYGLVLQADGPLRPDAFALHEPERFVVDLPGAEFGEPEQARSLLVQAAGVKRVRMAAQAGGGIRLVLDVGDASQYRVLQFADRKALVIAKRDESHARLAELMQGEGAPPGQGVQLGRVVLRQVGERVNLELEAPKPFALEVKDSRPTQLLLRLPGARYTGLLGASGGDWVQSVRAQTGRDGALELVLSLKPGHYQRSRSSEQGGKVQRLSWWRVEPRAFVGRPLVVIDPGHGGHDPGAIGPSGITEKEVCLKLALAFQKALRAKGINALLTRSSDEEVLLAPRLAMIDQVGADAFVSIHANAHSAGTEGLESYWREAPGRALATEMQSALVSSLGRPDRGVKQEQLYVLRHQRVPSTLVEVGFITNPREGAWMATPAFQQKATMGLMAGLERFWAKAPQSLGRTPLESPTVGLSSLGAMVGPVGP